jgi:hypothetical protein
LFVPYTTNKGKLIDCGINDPANPMKDGINQCDLNKALPAVAGGLGLLALLLCIGCVSYFEIPFISLSLVSFKRYIETTIGISISSSVVLVLATIFAAAAFGQQIMDIGGPDAVNFDDPCNIPGLTLSLTSLVIFVVALIMIYSKIGVDVNDTPLTYIKLPSNKHRF